MPTLPDTIPVTLAEIEHPLLAGPLARGVKYLHSIEILLISDGQKLVHFASEAGQAIVDAIKAEDDAFVAMLEAAKQRALDMERMFLEEASAIAKTAQEKIAAELAEVNEAFQKRAAADAAAEAVRLAALPPLEPMLDMHGNQILNADGSPVMVRKVKPAE